MHIGLPKTASTFLQGRFASCGDVAYVGRPFTQENRAFNSLQYADDCLFDGGELRRTVDDLAARYSHQRVLVLSDEMWSGFPFWGFSNRTMVADRLAAALPQAEVLLYLRNQHDLIRSLHNYYVKIGWFSGPLDADFISSPGDGFAVEAWLEGERTWRRSRRYIDNRSVCSVEHFRYSRLLALYHERFAKVHVRLYEDLAQDSEAHVLGLSEVLGAPGFAELPQERAEGAVNVSLASEPLLEQMVRNRLQGVTSPLAQRLLGPRLLKECRRAQARCTHHLRDLLQGAALAEDNRCVDARYALGMQAHSGYALQ